MKFRPMLVVASTLGMLTATVATAWGGIRPATTEV